MVCKRNGGPALVANARRGTKPRMHRQRAPSCLILAAEALGADGDGVDPEIEPCGTVTDSCFAPADAATDG